VWKSLNLCPYSPLWLQRQRVLLEVRYHHLVISTLRPFIRTRWRCSQSGLYGHRFRASRLVEKGAPVPLRALHHPIPSCEVFHDPTDRRLQYLLFEPRHDDHQYPKPESGDKPDWRAQSLGYTGWHPTENERRTTSRGGDPLLRGWSCAFHFQWDAILCTLGFVLSNPVCPPTPSRILVIVMAWFKQEIL
jgi:hypothetical protein